MKQLLLGTRNPAKIAILRAALAPLPVAVLCPADLGLDLDVVEDGHTTAENAAKKARAYCAAAGLPVLAIDGGLRVQGLPEEEQPGVRVRRVGGGEATDLEIVAHYARLLAALGGRAVGCWTGGVALALPTGPVIVDGYTYETLLSAERQGELTPGAPLDTLAVDPASGLPYARLPIEDRPGTRWLRAFVARHLAEL